MFGHDLGMTCEEFKGNRFRIDREIDEKHGLSCLQSLGLAVRILFNVLVNLIC